MLAACAQVYQDLCKKHPTFRERSENTELAVRPMSCAILSEHASWRQGSDQSMARGTPAGSVQAAAQHGRAWG